MRRFWQMVTFLMLALIVPASMCCHLVDLEFLEASDCCPCHEQGGNDERNPPSCPSDSISHSQIPESVYLPVAILAGQMTLAPGATNEMVSRDLDSARSRLRIEAPPDLSPTWAFAHRTALLARAPSVLV